MRFFSRLICAFAIAAAFAAAVNAAPRTIDDCESIQAPDAYNQCLALFGPVARGHAKTANVEEPGLADKTDAGSARADADVQAPDRHVAHAQGREKRRRSFSRSGGHRHRAAVAHHSRGAKSMRFSVVSGRTHLR